MKNQKEINQRLEELRAVVISETESLSYGELAELQSLKNHIEPGDVELLEAAGVPEDIRAIKLTEDQIETIKTALQYVYDRKLEIVSKNRKSLGKIATATILEQANKYFDLQNVFDAE